MLLPFSPAVAGAIAKGRRLREEDLEQKELRQLERQIREFELEKERRLLPLQIREAELAIQQRERALREYDIWLEKFPRLLELNMDEIQARIDLLRGDAQRIKALTEFYNEQLEQIRRMAQLDEGFRKVVGELTSLMKHRASLIEDIPVIASQVAALIAPGIPLDSEKLKGLVTTLGTKMKQILEANEQINRLAAEAIKYAPTPELMKYVVDMVMDTDPHQTPSLVAVELFTTARKIILTDVMRAKTGKDNLTPEMAEEEYKKLSPAEKQEVDETVRFQLMMFTFSPSVVLGLGLAIGDLLPKTITGPSWLNFWQGFTKTVADFIIRTRDQTIDLIKIQQKHQQFEMLMDFKWASLESLDAFRKATIGVNWAKVKAALEKLKLEEHKAKRREILEWLKTLVQANVRAFTSGLSFIRSGVVEQLKRFMNVIGKGVFEPDELRELAKFFFGFAFEVPGNSLSFDEKGNPIISLSALTGIQKWSLNLPFNIPGLPWDVVGGAQPGAEGTEGPGIPGAPGGLGFSGAPGAPGAPGGGPGTGMRGGMPFGFPFGLPFGYWGGVPMLPFDPRLLGYGYGSPMPGGQGFSLTGGGEGLGGAPSGLVSDIAFRGELRREVLYDIAKLTREQMQRILFGNAVWVPRFSAGDKSVPADIARKLKDPNFLRELGKQFNTKVVGHLSEFVNSDEFYNKVKERAKLLARDHPDWGVDALIQAAAEQVIREKARTLWKKHVTDKKYKDFSEFLYIDFRYVNVVPPPPQDQPGRLPPTGKFVEPGGQQPSNQQQRGPFRLYPVTAPKPQLTERQLLTLFEGTNAYIDQMWGIAPRVVKNMKSSRMIIMPHPHVFLKLQHPELSIPRLAQMAAAVEPYSWTVYSSAAAGGFAAPVFDPQKFAYNFLNKLRRNKWGVAGNYIIVKFDPRDPRATKYYIVVGWGKKLVDAKGNHILFKEVPPDVDTKALENLRAGTEKATDVTFFIRPLTPREITELFAGQWAPFANALLSFQPVTQLSNIPR